MSGSAAERDIVLKVSGLEKRFGSVQALAHVDFSLAPR